MTFGSLLSERAMMISCAAARPESPPLLIISLQRLVTGSPSRAGFPLAISTIVPIASEWSATTRKSSGRDRRAFWPVEVVTSSPRAKR